MTRLITVITPIKPVRTINAACRAFVKVRASFTNSNGQLYGTWVNPQLYVVYSYGEHWPLFMFSADTGYWYENEDKCTRTTARHHSQAHPHTPTHMRSCSWMKEAVRKGAAFILLSHCEVEEEPSVVRTTANQVGAI